MDRSKPPGIEIKQMYLTACEARYIDEGAERKYHFALTHLSRAESDNGLRLTVNASFDLMYGVEKPAFALKCSFRSVYTRRTTSAMTWAELHDHIVAAHLVPYVREFVSSVTLRLPTKPLILQPINAYLLVKDYSARAASERVAIAGAQNHTPPPAPQA